MKWHDQERERAAKRTAVYRLYDSSDQLLYVGISVDPEHRMTSHASNSFWWPHVARRSITWFDSRAEADDAETAAIRSERPLHNLRKQDSPSVVGEKPAVGPGEPKASHIADAVRQAIFLGVYPPGSRLPDRDLIGSHFGAAMATTGSALRMLHREGIISIQPSRGSFVRPIAFYEVRVTLVREMSADDADREIAAIQAGSAKSPDPAVEDLTVDLDRETWCWTWRMTVRGPDAGRAAATGMAAVVTASPATWNFTAASVTASRAHPAAADADVA